MEKRRITKKNKIWLILCLLFLAIAAAAIIALLVSHVRQKRAEALYEQLAGQAYVPDTGMLADYTKETEADILSELGITVPEKNLDWDALHEENEDIYAWIYVPDTEVDYPILQHPTDNSYYLNYNIDGTKGFPGCIYTEDYNAKDFSDLHTVIYGHNLTSGLMFSSLHNFEDEELVNEDHYIFIYTEDYVFVYQIFAVYEYPAIHLLANFDLTDETVYADYLEGIYEAEGRIANIREDIAVTAEDKIVTLSTCTFDHDAGLRFLVVGVLVNPR